VTTVKLDKVMADTNTSIEYETVPGPDGVQRAKLVTHLDPAREPAPRVYAPDDMRNPQYTSAPDGIFFSPATRGNGLDRHTQRRSTAHLSPVAKAKGDKLGNTATRTRPRSRRPPTRLRSHKFRPRLCTKARVVSKR
jgi:hypothetical protein